MLTKNFVIKNQSELEKHYIWPLIFALFLLLQCVISSGSYSGHKQHPKYGDYEAQRHWMEITVNLPIKEW
jgi:alpha-1,3-glucosyltransferase